MAEHKSNLYDFLHIPESDTDGMIMRGGVLTKRLTVIQRVAAGGEMERETLGVYQLKRLLGRGGMGAVYLAHDPRLARDVALKVLSAELARRPEFRERFVAEARTCSALNHPNITTIHDIGQAEGLDFIAFEYVEGETLESLLEREGKLSLERALEIALPLTDALAYAHGRGVVHRDLKPANVVVSVLGVPKILDFGLAKMMPGSVGPEAETLARLTQAGMIVGTLAYMAPEQALGESVDSRSDVFAFGCLLYEMLAGSPPFRGANAAQVLECILHEEPVLLERLRSDLPAGLVHVVHRALLKDVDARCRSMDELGSGLRQCAPASAAAFSSTHSKQVRRPWKRSRWWIAAASVAVLVSGALFLSDPAAVTEREHDAVAVMYFDNLSDPGDGAQTARMLTQLLTSELSSIEGLHIVSRQRLHDVARGLGLDGGEVDRSVATDVAEAAGVRTMVVGQVARAGGRIMATTELVDVDTGRSLSSQRAGTASADDVFVVAESLGQQVRERLATSEALAEGATLAEGASSTKLTASVESYRHYVQGDMHLHASELESAVESFGEALRLDPDFALAQFRLSMAARWLSDGPLAHQAARRAVALIDKAPAHLRDIIEANALYQDGAFSQAIPLLDNVLARDPEQKEALYIRSQIYVHSLRDGDPALAVADMERLLSLDPTFHQVYDRLALSYAFQGDLEKARERLGEWAAIRPDKVAGIRSVLATIEGNPEEALGFGQAFSWIEGPLFQAAAAMMASRWDLARRLVEQDPEEWRSDHLRAWALRNRAVFHAYVGEFDTSLVYFRQAGMASGLRTHEGGSGGVPASALQIMAELLRIHGTVGAARAEVERALSIQPESWRGLYFAGRMALFDEDIESARRHLERLRGLPATESSLSARVYLRALEGELSLRTGEAARARDIFEELVAGSLMLDWASTCSSADAIIRDGLARSYLALEDEASAIEALESLLASGAERLDHPVIYTSALYRLGILKMETGRKMEGRRLLEKFLEHWGDSDWELDIVEDARARLSS